MKILMLTRYGHLGASSRLRSLQYIPYLKKLGFEIEITSLFDDEYIQELYRIRRKNINELNGKTLYTSQSSVPISINEKSKKRIALSYVKRFKILLTSYNYDLLWIEKELFPWLPPLAEQVLRWVRIPYLIDIDDAIFHKYDSHGSGWVRFILGNKIRSVMSNANLVVAGNNYLAQYARDAGAPKVEIIPTVIELSRYPLNYLRPVTDGPVKIGWIGTPSTVWYLSVIKDILQKIQQSYPIELVIVGGGVMDIGSVPVKSFDWSEETEVINIQSFDIGIMPLTNSPFELGKCGYKLIQYMACSIPVIASNVGVNSDIIDHGINGFIANTENEWFESLEKLIIDDTMRRDMGRSGRAKVEVEFCSNSGVNKWAEILNNVLPNAS